MTPCKKLILPALAATLLALAACSQEEETAQAPATDSQATQERAFTYGDVDRERLLNADAEPGNWFTTGRDAGKGHYSPLDQINRENVSRLGLAWQYETFTNRGLEATPIVVDGIMYTSGTTGRVYALDAKTGEEIWYFDPEVDRQYNRYNCCDEVNRGVAVWKGKVYVAALDGWLYALDAATGEVIWSVQTIVDNGRAYNITGAPEIAGDVVVIGSGGAEYDARGYFAAYDLDTGEFKWRFFTVPRDPELGQEHPELEMALETWDPNSRWDVGGGGTAWNGMAYDWDLNLLYVTTGNANNYNWKERSPSGGDNLFTCSILAINPDTGRMVWYYQEVPGDEWDFDSNQPLILTDLEIDGETRKVLMQAPKNGFFYVLDRATGEVLSADKFTPVNWASHVDLETGRPQVNPEARYSADGPVFVYPTNMGAHNWHPMSYSPDTGLVYIPIIEATMIITDFTEGQEFRPKMLNSGTSLIFGDMMLADIENVPPPFREVFKKAKEAGDIRSRSLVAAFDPKTGETVWEQPTVNVGDRSGVLSTAGGLVFKGTDQGYFYAYDAETGEELLKTKIGTSIMAAPMSYTVDGEQYVSVMAAFGGGGWSVPPATSALRKYGNDGRILTFKLDGGDVPIPPELPPVGPIPEPPAQTASAEQIAKGGELFANCRICHSNDPEVGTIPDLRRMSADTHAEFNDIVLRGARVDRAMPRWDDVMDEADADALHAYLITESWKAYDAQEAGKEVEEEIEAAPTAH